jgi:hypothetical protein
VTTGYSQEPQWTQAVGGPDPTAVPGFLHCWLVGRLGPRGVHDDGRLVILYRQAPGGALLARAWDIGDEPANYGLANGAGNDAAVLAPLIFYGDIDDPSEPGN